MRVLVTGGAGFIGSHLVDSLVRDGVATAVLDDFSSGKEENLPPAAERFVADVRDAAAVERVFAAFRPTHVSHHAAQISVAVSVREPRHDADVNIGGGLNVLDACVRHGVKKLVFASTGGVMYGEVPAGERAAESRPAQPSNPYATSKRAFELYLDTYRAQYGLDSAALRYGNVFGPRQDPHGEAGVVAIFARRLLGGEPVQVNARRVKGDAGCERDYIFVQDVIAAHRFVLSSNLGGVFNVGTGTRRSTQEILDALCAALKVRPEVRHADRRPGDLESTVLDPEKLTASGWRATTPFADGVLQTALWFRERAALPLAG